MNTEPTGTDRARRRTFSCIGGVLAAAAVGLPFRARAAAREIQIVMLLPLQGGQARQAEMIRQGVDGALEQANRAGGIRGQPVKLLAIDNGYQAEKTVEAIGSLAARESVVAVTSLFGGPIIGAAIPAATRAGVPIVGVLHGNDAFRRPGTEIVTHVRATFDAEIRAIAALFPTIGRSRFAVLHATDNSGTAFRAQFESVLKAQGLPLVAAVPYARDATDYTEQARSIERSGADVVVVGGVTATGIAAIRAKVATKLWAQMVCLSTVDERSVWEQVGADAVGTAFSSVVPNPYATLLPLAREYQAAMKARNYDRLSLSSFEGYINAQVLLEGLRRAPGLTRPALQANLSAMQGVSLGGVSFSAPTEGKIASGIDLADILVMTHNGRMLR